MCFKRRTPNIYLLHGELSDVQMNELYNHPKIKSMISLTKGEGFADPLEFTTSGKPLIVSNFSGHVDFLDKDMTIMLGGSLQEVHKDHNPEKYRFKGAKWFQIDFSQAHFYATEIYKNYDKWFTKSYGHKTNVFTIYFR